MAGEGYIAKNTAGKLLFPEKSLLDIVHGHAKWAAIASCRLDSVLFYTMAHVFKVERNS